MDEIGNVLLRGLAEFEKCPEISNIAGECAQLKDDLQCGRKDSIAAMRFLAENLRDLKLTQTVGKCFPSILVSLVSEVIPISEISSKNVETDVAELEYQHRIACTILGELVLKHPDILKYSLRYFTMNAAPFATYAKLNVETPPKIRRLSKKFDVTDKQLIASCLSFLRSAPNIFRLKWDWSDFVEKFYRTSDEEQKWLVCRCLAIVTGMSEGQANKFYSSAFSDVAVINNYKIKEIADENNYFITTKGAEDPISDINCILSMLPVSNAENVVAGRLVHVKSTIDNLRSITLAIASGKGICLCGPVGSGKTSLVEYLAAVTGRQGTAMKKVQLGDQTDSRMLLGTYKCTDIPGGFVWQPGILTEAVQKGYWLLLEDIDCAALDVASVLSSLLEQNVLSVPEYREAIPVDPGFQLFVTQRSSTLNGRQKPVSNASALLQRHLTQIHIEPLSRHELLDVVQNLFPNLKTIASKMIDVFLLFSAGNHDCSLQNEIEQNEYESQLESIIKNNPELFPLRFGRQISTRDLLKWCSRASVDFVVWSQESGLKVLHDAIDIFTCCASQPGDRLRLAKAVAACLGIVEMKAEFYCNLQKPHISVTPDAFEVGRATVPRKEKTLHSLNLNSKSVTFSFTRPSVCLLERISCCVVLSEPVLLVGETGTGKTSSVQYLARQTGNNLIVINMNQQSESADLLGGFKPVDLKFVMEPVRKDFEELFREYYVASKNINFLNHINTTFVSRHWANLISLMKHGQTAAVRNLTALKMKKALTETQEAFLLRWLELGKKIIKMELQSKSQNSLAFAFIEGSLVRAMQNGDWVLLDEINLASAETLECLAGLLEGPDATIALLEKGNNETIRRDANFRLFACMNPATDVGKKDLPVGLRNRFTEFFVDDLTDRNDILQLVGDYLKDLNLPKTILDSIYKFYSTIKKEAKLNLTDGTGHAPHYSLRTLCRALMTAQKVDCGTISRSLYEAFCLSFLTQLDRASHPKVQAMVAKAVLGNKEIKSVLNQAIPQPKQDSNKYLLFEGYWIPQGTLQPNAPKEYILTASIKKNLRDLARIVSLGKLPVLLQGDTSVGKTSLITYLAKASGNYCVRINNHEHTDLQEYVGCYTSNSEGKLAFKEGVLVEAMRKGHWIILDELNLAPSDVLEALNRVLDDNRELFIPETQEVVRANANFMLFATQNPPGLYGGRKVLSRAFRNRFVELHFDEIPRAELETILHHRCSIPPSYCKRMIAVMAELQTRRKGTAAVQGKQGFITLRDLFRWGQRYKLADQYEYNSYYDWDQHIADEGYLVLGARIRNVDEMAVIQQVISKHFKRTVDPDSLFTLSDKTSSVTKPILQSVTSFLNAEFRNIVWTYNMRKLAVLIMKAFTFKEPVLLVGETGCGKTTVCEIIAAIRASRLLTVNCHMYTESADFLGGLRPVRQYQNDGKLFEWCDGPLVQAMTTGDLFLADEISLADDSVLERLNSLLEPERELFLAEKSAGYETDLANVISAHDTFRFIGTMNPGGDYGKKELSPALRNRFTEIWCTCISSRDDTILILDKIAQFPRIGRHIMDFVEWFKRTPIGVKYPCSIRDLLSWVQFMNEVGKQGLSVAEAYVHGACLVLLDSFGSGMTGTETAASLASFRHKCIEYLTNQIGSYNFTSHEISFARANDTFGFAPFYIQCGSTPIDKVTRVDFLFDAPTTEINTTRLLRALQLQKAILLEGSPGVGKTSLVLGLAKAAGHNVYRYNLSEQTDISDLFGTDLPTEDGCFAFKEGAFLTALKNGDWILLDELNLAPQSVLEGLNACLDHRGEVFIPELGKTFAVKQGTRIFACQNPLKQGGSRKGLPMSFLNRFTQVYAESLSADDLLFIAEGLFPNISKDILKRMIDFNERLSHEVTELQLWGHRGSPWELNLRDIQRWGDALVSMADGKPGSVVELLYVDRMRTKQDKERVLNIYKDIFYPKYPLSSNTPLFYITTDRLYVGDVSVTRNVKLIAEVPAKPDNDLLILRNQLPVLKSLMQCVNMNWLAIMIGPTASGKNSIIRVLSQLAGKKLKVLPVTPTMDTTDILGGFEQTDYNRHLEGISIKVEDLVKRIIQDMLIEGEEDDAMRLLSQWTKYSHMQLSDNEASASQTMEEESAYFEKRKHRLQSLLSCLSWSPSPRVRIFKGEAEELLEQLKILTHRFNKAESLNAGGKFDWVDSLLVKCLLDGSWLLVDNVNLCTSAVLDRLNGLLEKGGMLNIPERGENIADIKPHPDFRLFFTMDPKNGEISRAMRNRGVEIYMLGQETSVGAALMDSIPALDLSAMLSSLGLPSSYHHICSVLHEEMCSFLHNYDKPSLNHFLHAIFLTCQQYQRGLDLKTSLVYSFSDVYIKPRMKSDFVNALTAAANKQKMVAELKKILSSTDLTNGSFIEASHTISLSDIQSVSSSPIVKQNAFLPYHFFNLSKTMGGNECILRSASLLVNSYRVTPQSNVDMHYQYVRMMLSNEDQGQWIRNINDTIYADVKTATFDPRFYPEITADINESSSNQAALLLYINVAISAKNVFTKQCDTSVLEYSKAVINGDISDDFPEHPILKYCSLLIKYFESWFSGTLRCNDLSISNGAYCDALQFQRWVDRFNQVCSESKFNRKQTGISILPLIHIHYRWLNKFRHSKMAHFPDLQDDVFKCVDSSLDTDALPLRKIGNRIRKNNGRSLFYENKTDYENHALFTKLSRELRIVSIDSIALTKRKLKLLLSDSFTIKSAALKFNLTESPFTASDFDYLESVVPTLVDGDIEMNQNLADSMKTFQFDVNLWPLQEYLVLRILTYCKSWISSDEPAENRRHERVLKNLCSMAESVKSFPIEISNLLRRLIDGCPSNSFNSKSTLLANLSELSTLHMECSPCTRLDDYWLHWKLEQLLDTNIEESVMSKERQSLNVPMLLNIIYKLVVAEDHSITESKVTNYASQVVSSLGDQQHRSEQLCKIQHLVHDNISTLSLATNQHVLSEAIFCLNAFKSFIALLYRALSRNLDCVINPIIADLIEDCIEMFEGLYTECGIRLRPGDKSKKEQIITCLKMLIDHAPSLEILVNDRSESDFELKMLTGQVATLHGVLAAAFMSNIEPIDPVEKSILKKKYLQNDMDDYDELLYIHFLQGIVMGSVQHAGRLDKALPEHLPEMDDKTVGQLERMHPHCREFLDRKRDIKQRLISKNVFCAYRPETSLYQTFANQINYSSHSLLSPDVLLNLYKDLVGTNERLHSFIVSGSYGSSAQLYLKTATEVVKGAKTWRNSLKNFYTKLSKEYSDLFPEIVKPLLNGAMQLCQGIGALGFSAEEQTAAIRCRGGAGRTLSDHVQRLIRFPAYCENCPDTFKLVDSLTSTEFAALLHKNLKPSEEDPTPDQVECYRLLKVCLQELKNFSAWHGNLNSATMNKLSELLNVAVTLWQKQQVEMEKKKQEDDDLYVTRSKCEDIPEDQEFDEEMLEAFPSYTEDFVDLQPITLDQRPLTAKKTSKINPPHELIMIEDLQFISRIHSEVMRKCTFTEWLQTPDGSQLSRNHLSALLQRYVTFGKLLPGVQSTLDLKIEEKISPSLLVLLDYAKGTVDGTISSETMNDFSGMVNDDFYRSPNVHQCATGLPIVNQVVTATSMLLQQWPDFPTLKHIMIVAKRILDFPITSPVAKILTGLELLREKVEEWNKNAHKGNNMANESLCLAQQIIKWRKMELSSWKNCLDNALARKSQEACKWWFLMYAVIDSFLNNKPFTSEVKEMTQNIKESDERSPQQLAPVLMQFMEQSNLAEFNKRLDIIFVFHCHAANLKSSPTRDEVLSILWNVYKYYNQFSANVNAYVKEKRTPIEKKLKDFVKICSWDRDLSYWGVKDNVVKAHRTLHKHVKEFEAILSMGVGDCLSMDSGLERSTELAVRWDRPKRGNANVFLYMADPENYLAQSRFTKKILDQIASNQKGLISRVPSLFDKAKKLCKYSMLHSVYPGLIQGLNDFVTKVIETSKELQAIEVSPDLPKEKQKSQAKSFLQLKRKMLSELFRALAKIGLSYRAGIIALSKSDNKLMDPLLPPVDLEAALTYLKTRRSDAALTSIWSGCEEYFQRSIARQSALTKALRSPAADLGPQNAERCKGFAANLTTIAQSQKRLIAKHSRQLCHLRNLVTQATSLMDNDTLPPKPSKVEYRLEKLCNIYTKVGLILEQFTIVLEAVPTTASPDAFDVSVVCKNSKEWTVIRDGVNRIINTANKQISALNKIKISMPCSFMSNENSKRIYTQPQNDVIEAAIEKLQTMEVEISDLLKSYECSDLNNPMASSLVYVCKFLKSENESLSSFTARLAPSEGCTDLSQFENSLENLTKSILLIIQKKYTQYVTASAETDEVEVVEDDTIQKGHLKQMLHDSLTSDINDLSIGNLNTSLENLLGSIVHVIENETEEYTRYKHKLLAVIPLLEQATLFIQYFITQQVAAHRVTCKMLSVLLNIFIELATKGFCTPANLEMEEGEGDGGPGKVSGGMGLGEGEGLKDVSDKIENQDQLDDAKKPGEQDKEDNRDCKEEEKGVNMTDDFDSHLQDLENENDKDNNSDEDDTEDNADKQMGDTDPNAERLDQQLWGSDDKEDDENPDKSDKDERGGGESLDDQQMVGKEDTTKDNPENEPDNQKDKNKKKNDINEMDEPEVDDDHIDPYHGNNPKLPEPEDFDLPDNLQLDGEQQNDDEDDGNMENENPFEIDKMRDQEDKPEEDDKNTDENDSSKVDKDKGKVNDGSDTSDDDENEGDVKNDETEKEDAEGEPNEEEGNMEEGQADQNDIEDEPGAEKPPPEKKPSTQADSIDDQPDEEEAEKTQPSNDANSYEDKPTEEQAESAQADKGSEDNVQTNPDIDKSMKAAPYNQPQDHDGEEREATGQSELSDAQKGHKGQRDDVPRTSMKQNVNQQKDDQRNKRNKPGQTDSDRTLGETSEPVQKKLKSLNIQNDDSKENDDQNDAAEEEEQGDIEADMYQHIKQAKKMDVQAIDAATKDQAETQPVPNKPDENAEEAIEDEDWHMDLDNVEVDEDAAEKLEAEKTPGDKEKKERNRDNTEKTGDEVPTGETAIEIEGSNVETMGVQRGAETTYHTNFDSASISMEDHSLSNEELNSLRVFVNASSSANLRANDSAAEDAWRHLWGRTTSQARQLSEKLRLVLEPTGRSRLAGDFRTGRRINMRRVIPYIASQFRKDRIWLRRTKPSKREYKIAVAMDNSSSMSDNQSKELAFESLALVSQALNLLEAGELSVLSFGETPSILHAFGDHFSEHSGAKLLQNLAFDQTKTRIAQLLDFASVMFEEHCAASAALNAKLLVIVSDGCGIFSEGEEKVIQTVRRVRQQGIFLVYLIIDNPKKKNSIMDIRTPILNPVTNALDGFQPYLDSFPFPYYLILRDISSLPSVLSDALRQWFELAANCDR